MAKNNKLPEIPQTIDMTSDFSEDDLKKIQLFEADGLPGIASIEEVNLTRMMDLYLSGKTYRQISNTLRIPKPVILYMSHKFNWFELKREYMNELEFSIRNRMLDAKLISQDFLLEIQQLYQKKIGGKIRKYLATDNEDFANAIDLKEVDRYIKVIGMLHTLTTEKSGSGGNNPAVGLNLGEGVTVKKIGDNEVEITPKEKTVASMLKQFADYRREEQKANKRSDINVKDVTPEVEIKGETSEEE